VLLGDVGLGAVGGDAGHPRAPLVHLAQVVGHPDAGQQQHGDAGAADGRGGRGDQLAVVGPGETVVERRAAEPVAVADLDDGHAGRVEAAGDLGDLLGGELVRQRVRAVAQGGVGQAEGAHPPAPALASARAVPTRTAAAVMMSRLPAKGGR
jgi:hypothetical protein